MSMVVAGMSGAGPYLICINIIEQSAGIVEFGSK
jgi:hypothetical protein